MNIVKGSYFWILVLALLYIVLSYVVFLFGIESYQPYGVAFPDVHFFYYDTLLVDLFIIIFAVTRVTRLITKDSVFQPIHKALMGNPNFCWGLSDATLTLLRCPWCVSMWSALGVIFLYAFSEFTAFLVVLLALSGAAMMIYFMGVRLALWNEQKDR